MKLNLETGWLEGISHCPSPHYDERPTGMDIDLIVIHGISLPPGEFGGPFIEQLFTQTLASDAHPYFATIAQLRVSAHVLIRRTGEITQYVSLFQRAWHAGVSCFAGRTRCNDFSVGIELEGSDEVPYTDEQYQQLAKLINLLQQVWPNINRNSIVGHCDIAPGRKTDPGPAFDWERLHELMKFGSLPSSTG
ncbi:N-acetylmuramyl-L-alanine amidase, negative regulator of AmpC, AmpD [Thioploca ingrica]|uniref:1,6-anhydro-N-acetylmuramyl-L-alanine amidase AmpD n=1 Tax=Thioploca ingrica TaxID=40754 RepID=A0A090AKW1_9GAMM|nr:N-acetylmuramyl-L-alanine amidase, negative regulator of AmpC, AmpD [Thioploca ingrica]